jgi:nucleotide-binding universal stress UspA family protein
MNATATANRKQIQLNNVLFATDFSQSASAAMPYAKSITKAFGAHLTVLHVRPPVVNPMTPPATWASAEEAAKVREEWQRNELSEQFAGFHADILMPEGDIRAELPDILRQKKIDLLVIGTHGRSGVKKLFLGSVAEEIFRDVSCPVLTVGPNAARGFGSDGGPHKILYATDFNSESQLAAGYAVSLAEEFQASLTLTHCLPAPATGELVNASQLETHYRKLLSNLVPIEAEAWCKVECVVKHGDSANGILETARERNIDLIVLGVRPETGFPGASTHLPLATAHKVVSQAECPVLTIRH